MNTRSLLGLGMLLTLGSPTLHAQSCEPGHRLDPAQLQQLDLDEYRNAKHMRLPSGRSYRIERIHIVRQNVFPDRQHWLARQANRFNVVTKEYALRAALPVTEGEAVNQTQLEEAERILRGKSFLYDALIMVRQMCADQVELDVIVRDVWTLNPNIGVARSGGDNEFNLGLSDINALGTGKSVSVEYFDDRDRSGAVLSFTDPNVLSSRWTARLVAAENDDGERYRVGLSRPFFALDTPRAFGFNAERFSREEDLEFLGRDLFEIDATTDRASVFYGFSDGRQNGWVNRWYVGARYLRERFEFPADFPGPTETEREFVYPYIAFESIQDRFAERTNVDRVGINEDVKLGWSSYVELGYSDERFGGQGDFLLGQARVGNRSYLNDKHLLSFAARLVGRYETSEDRSEDVEATVNLNYLWQQSPNWRFFARLSATHTRNLQLDRQLTLGGDSGLRGYPSRYQPGDQRYLFTVEQRYHSNVYPFGLLRLGYAAFIDVGRARFADDPPAYLPPRNGDAFGTLANVGFGLRLESTRTRRDRVIHIDFAKPLVDGPFVDSLEVTISAKRSF